MFGFLVFLLHIRKIPQHIILSLVLHLRKIDSELLNLLLSIGFYIVSSKLVTNFYEYGIYPLLSNRLWAHTNILGLPATLVEQWLGWAIFSEDRISH